MAIPELKLNTKVLNSIIDELKLFQTKYAEKQKEIKALKLQVKKLKKQVDSQNDINMTYYNK